MSAPLAPVTIRLRRVPWGATALVCAGAVIGLGWSASALQRAGVLLKAGPLLSGLPKASGKLQALRVPLGFLRFQPKELEKVAMRFWKQHRHENFRLAAGNARATA